MHYSSHLLHIIYHQQSEPNKISHHNGKECQGEGVEDKVGKVSGKFEELN